MTSNGVGTVYVRIRVSSYLIGANDGSSNSHGDFITDPAPPVIPRSLYAAGCAYSFLNESVYIFGGRRDNFK